MKRQRCLSAFAVACCLLGCREERRTSTTADIVSPEEHAVLAGSFVSGDTSDLADLLDNQLVVQPPPPDTALGGAPARRYLLGLAANTSVVESQFHPEVIRPEGSFAYEQGLWELDTGRDRLVSRYVLRWRRSPAGWRVVLWRWGPFR
ncbi:MAG TPA: hypothetical protein VHH32_03275 [Gemmatimonadales bacterium]|nr:hypothetical protein [Gemmatimonadales bacterium]